MTTSDGSTDGAPAPVHGTEGDDSLSADPSGSEIFGGGGSDALAGGDGNDGLYGGTEDDTLTGGSGDDALSGGDGDDVLRGEAGADTLEGGAGADLLNGGGGSDTLRGGAGEDRLDGAGGADLMEGDEGADTLYGGTGNDALYGGGGDDLLLGGSGDDLLDGGAGADRFRVRSDHGETTVSGGEEDAATDLLDFGFAEDLAGGGVTVTFTGDEAGSYSFNPGTGIPGSGSFTGIEAVQGSYLGDTIDASAAAAPVVADGGAGDDSLTGGSGDDALAGGAGEDALAGGAGSDALSGGDGADSLRGGAGDDSLTGGAGEDLFVLDLAGGRDVIADFDLSDPLGTGRSTDQLDVGALRTPGGDALRPGDVTVGDDGHGNALLSFPGGESVVLLGVAPAQMTMAQLAASGIPCLTAGTPVLTPWGEVPAETLRAGDLVCTRDAGPQPVIWAARRHVPPAELAAAPGLAPVRIAAGTLGCTVPLLVSPQHGMLLEVPGQGECLVRAIHLARLRGGAVRIARGRRSVRYVHLMFERHQILRAGGAWSESFYPGPWALAMLDAGALLSLSRLLPELMRKGAGLGYGPTARRVARFRDLPGSLAELGLPGRDAGAGPRSAPRSAGPLAATAATGLAAGPRRVSGGSG